MIRSVSLILLSVLLIKRVKQSAFRVKLTSMRLYVHTLACSVYTADSQFEDVTSLNTSKNNVKEHIIALNVV